MKYRVQDQEEDQREPGQHVESGKIIVTKGGFQS